MKNTAFTNIFLIFLLSLNSNVSLAGLVGVSQIKITSSASSDAWLQISEIIATESGSGNDLALTTAGATATSSGNHDPHGSGHSEELFVLDGTAPGDWYANELYHSNSPTGAWLTVTLAAASELDSISLFGRTDCCSIRDIYYIQLFDSTGNTLFTADNLNANNNQHSVSLNLPVSNVPVPASIWLFTSGLIAFTGMKRNSKAK